MILGAVVVFVAKPFSSGDKTVGSSQSLPPLALPGCSTQTARASQLSHVTSHMVAASGHPFDVAVTPGFAFVSGAGSGLSVMNTQKSVPVGMWDSAPLDHAQGEALTPDGHFLVVTGGSGITVFRVSDLEQRAGATAMGSLASPGQAHAEDVAITPDGRFAFVTFQNSASVGVFDLQRALSSGFGSGDVVGLIPVGPQPIGIAIPPDGQHAYVASQASTAGGRAAERHRRAPGGAASRSLQRDQEGASRVQAQPDRLLGGRPESVGDRGGLQRPARVLDRQAAERSRARPPGPRRARPVTARAGRRQPRIPHRGRRLQQGSPAGVHGQPRGGQREQGAGP